MRTALQALALCLLLAAPATAQNIGAQFKAGMAALGEAGYAKGEARTAKLDEAIAIFRAILVKRPELVRVRLELARAFFLKEEDTLARRHFEMVLAGKPPAAVALNVNRFLRIMRARKRWSVRLGMSLLPDTNIGAGSDEQIIYIDTAFGRLPFTRDQEELTSSGIGIAAWVGGEYQYPVGERWRLRAGGNLSRREYKTSRFDQMTVAGHIGPRWLIGRGSEVSLLLSGVHVWTGKGIEEPSHHDIGLARRGQAPAHPPDDTDRAPVPARTPLRQAGPPRRADHRCLAGHPLGGLANGPHQRIDRLGALAAGDRTRAPHPPLGPGGRNRRAALGLHRGRLGRAALDRLRGRSGSPSCRRRRAAQRPHPHHPPVRPQPGPDRRRASARSSR